MNTINLTALSPVEHDLLLLERQQLENKAHFERGLLARDLVWRYGKSIYVRGERYSEIVYIAPDTVSVPTTLAETVHFTAEDALRFASDEDIAKYNNACEVLAEAVALVEECHVEYARRPWNRYYLVTSSDGHIHSSTHCSTCNKGKEPTGFALVPYLSGATAKDAVADLGSSLCSVCFPDAPVEDREQVKISARVALVLAEQGVEAFQQARAKARADAQKRASDRCEGSGHILPTNNITYWRRYAPCPVCESSQSVSSTGKVRAHRRPTVKA